MEGKSGCELGEKGEEGRREGGKEEKKKRSGRMEIRVHFLKLMIRNKMRKDSRRKSMNRIN